MSKKDSTKGVTLNDGLLAAMKALDNQIARRMQRNPEQKEVHGVQKWEPQAEKVEEVTAFILESFGAQKVDLDSILVLSQAFTKSLYLLSEELGQEGLGELRANYCKSAFEIISRDSSCGSETLDAREIVQ